VVGKSNPQGGAVPERRTADAQRIMSALCVGGPADGQRVDVECYRGVPYRTAFIAVIDDAAVSLRFETTDALTAAAERGISWDAYVWSAERSTMEFEHAP
jgi:hypothetical protein